MWYLCRSARDTRNLKGKVMEALTSWLNLPKLTWHIYQCWFSQASSWSSSWRASKSLCALTFRSWAVVGLVPQARLFPEILVTPSYSKQPDKKADLPRASGWTTLERKRTGKASFPGHANDSQTKGVGQETEREPWKDKDTRMEMHFWSEKIMKILTQESYYYCEKKGGSKGQQNH